MRILLISPNYYHEANASYFPIGLACISAYIKNYGHDVIGLNLNHIVPDKRIAALHNAILDKRPDVIGISGLTVAFEKIEQLIQFIRKISPTSPIVVGGGIAAVEGELMMRTLRPDYAVVGEGEIIFSQLLDAIENQKNPATVKGIWYWHNSDPVYTGEGEFPKRLDDLPFPDIETFGMREHLRLQNNEGQISYHLTRLDTSRTLPISASRSCPFHCTFCHHAGMREYKAHSIVRLVDQIKQYIELYGIYNFFIYDELFSAKKKRVREFCNLLKKYNLNIKWFCQLRMDQLDLETLLMIKESGCNYISFGIESGSNTVLNSMRKRITTDTIKNAVAMVREAKIGIQGNFLYGDPAEDETTIRESIKFQEENELFYCDWSAVIPYAGTQIFHYALDKGLIPDKEAFIRSLCNTSKYLYKDKINLSKLSDDQYQEWYIYLRELNDLNHRKRCAQIVHGEIVSKWSSKITIRCPVCSKEQVLHLHYPLEQKNNKPILKGAIGVQGINVLCPDCGRKMHIKANSIPHMAIVYNKFQNKIDRVTRHGHRLSVLPSLDRFASTFMEDININPDLVEAVYDTRQFRKGSLFLNKATKILETDFSALEGKTVVLLPWVEYETILSGLCEQHVSPQQIICWNTLFR